jgi:hypothetical protein
LVVEQQACQHCLADDRGVVELADDLVAVVVVLGALMS